jgi:hypothetical protein
MCIEYKRHHVTILEASQLGEARSVVAKTDTQVGVEIQVLQTNSSELFLYLDIYERFLHFIVWPGKIKSRIFHKK